MVVVFPVPVNIKSRDMVVEIKRNSIKAGIKGQEPVIQGDFPNPVALDDVEPWSMLEENGVKTVEIPLLKVNQQEWWPHVVTSAPTVDITMIEPEEQSLSSTKGEVRAMAEKMMWENSRSEEDKQKDKVAENMKRLKELERQTGMDFSQADIHHG